MNIPENKKISALVIDADGIICNKASLDKAAQNSSMKIALDDKLIEIINNTLYNDIYVIWISDSATDDAKQDIKAILGNLHERTPIIGREVKTAEHDPDFYERSVHEKLKERSIAPNEAILISSHGLSNKAIPKIKKLSTIAIIDTPEKLVKCLKDVNFYHLLNGSCQG
ncbi:MAG: hypothetical protein WC788_09150 [Candidatus Paceibacterota bacterium]|jgi:Ni2+-binding GTPase involved in maturation of urease and hydrogenase